MSTIQHPSVGWFSKLDVALVTKKRIVLHGNVKDYIERRGITLVDWLERRLQTEGYDRIVYYDFDKMPAILRWGDMDPDSEEVRQQFDRLTTPPASRRGQGAMGQQAGQELEKMRNLLEFEEAPAAVILSNAEYRVTYPTSSEAARLNTLVDNAARASLGSGETNIPTSEMSDATENELQYQRRVQNIAIHIYSLETQIPTGFISGDPDTGLISIPVPNLETRQRFIEQLDAAGFDSIELTRATEGYYLKEIEQLITLARVQNIGGDELDTLLRLFRHGRRVDFWKGKRLNETGEEISKRLKGQDNAIENIIECLCAAKHKIYQILDSSSKRPPLVFFFVGATGIGKTLMARALADSLVGSEENLCRFDMSEYRQEHTDQRLIGPPPGYVGHLQGGQLTNWVKNRPHSVVLFDEVEKAHERILDNFLQILDGARLTDGKGETVDFSETILIFTSNIGTAEAIDDGVDTSDPNAVRAHYLKTVEEHFAEIIERPELFNRLRPSIVVFDYIKLAVAENAISAKLRDITEAVRREMIGRGLPTNIVFAPKERENDREVVAQLISRTQYDKYGLREVNNVIQAKVGVALATLLENRNPKDQYQYYWDAAKERIRIIPL